PNWMKHRFGGSLTTKNVDLEKHSVGKDWEANHNRALTFLAKILPYLKEKEKIRRATLILVEYKSVTKRNGKYTLEEHKAKLEFEKRFFDSPFKKSRQHPRPSV